MKVQIYQWMLTIILSPPLQCVGGMNHDDRNYILDQITSILDPVVANWSVIEVQQFLEIINCGLFSKIVTAFGINGQMLLQQSKIQALFIPQLKPSTTLLFQKVMFIIEELKPKQHRSAFKTQRRSRRLPRSPMYITDNLMKMFAMGVDLVRQKNIVLWTTEDLLTFLSVIGYSAFAKIAKQTNCDGLIMLYILPDSRKTVRTFKSLKIAECKEFLYVSQILLAQHMMEKDREQEETKQIGFRRRLHSEAIIEIKDNNQQSNLESSQKLVAIAESMDNQSSPTSSPPKPIDHKLILESIENVQKERESENHKSNSGSGGNSLNQSRLPRREEGERNVFSLDQNKELVADSLQNPSVFRSHHLQSSREIVFARSYYQDEVPDRDKHKERQKQKTEKALEKSESEFKFARSQYSNLEVSQSKNRFQVIQETPEIDFEMNEQAYEKGEQKQQKPFVLATSQFPSQSIKSVKLPQSKKVHNTFLERIKMKKMQEKTQKDLNRIAELVATGFNPPFNLMNFKSLNSITLGEVKFTMQSQDHNEFVLANEQSTFGVKGCKFGRNPANDYCYPDELSISSRHAIIFFLGNNFFLQDLGSKLGTFKQVSYLQIYNGLIIQLSFELQLAFEIVRKNNEEDQLKVTFNDLKKEHNQASINLKRQSYYIGRAPTCQIPINSGYLTISAKHAKIYQSENRFYFEDTNSRYGSWLRLSKKETKSQLHPVFTGDKIRISSKKIFHISNVEISQTISD